MTLKYICNYCGEEITDPSNIFKLIEGLPDFDDDVIGHYHGPCFDKVIKTVKELTSCNQTVGDKK